jgi:hypothetical protein
VIRSLSPDKSPGLDGFTAIFLQVAWTVIRADLMSAFDALWHMDARGFHCINDTLITLLPKGDSPQSIKDYHPISLIHIIGKLISKVLATWLASRIGELVHPSQSAFIKGHVIQDNFKYVHAAAKLLHARKLPTLLLKVELAHAFDSIAWPFLIEVMEFMGFPTIWHEWVSVLLSSISMKVLMNSMLVERICHAHGLRQGDPPS